MLMARYRVSVWVYPSPSNPRGLEYFRSLVNSKITRDDFGYVSNYNPAEFDLYHPSANWRYVDEVAAVRYKYIEFDENELDIKLLSKILSLISPNGELRSRGMEYYIRLERINE